LAPGANLAIKGNNNSEVKQIALVVEKIILRGFFKRF